MALPSAGLLVSIWTLCGNGHLTATAPTEGTALDVEERAFMELIPSTPLASHGQPPEELRGFLWASRDGCKITSQNNPEMPKLPSLNQKLKRVGSSWEDLSLGRQPRGSAGGFSELLFSSP